MQIQKKRLLTSGAFLLLALTLSLWLRPETLAAPLLVPANDNFANAEDITAGPFPVTLTNVDLPTSSTTLEGGEASCGTFGTDTSSVWYKITPTGNGQLTATVTPQNDDDVTIGLFTAIGTSTICADADTGGGVAETFPNQPLTANTTYWIRVAADFGFNSLEQANVSITFTPDAPPAGPEIQVLDGTTDIPDNTGTVNLGSVSLNGDPLTKTITIKNTGTANLTVNNDLNVGGGFVTNAPFPTLPATISPNGQIQFGVQFFPGGKNVGVNNGTVSFTNDDADESPFNFALAATVVLIPEATVHDGSSSSSSPVIADNTGNVSFGTTTVGVPVIKDFLIANIKGSANLTLGNVQVTGPGFSLVQNIATTTVVSATSGPVFSLKFTPTTAGTFNGTVSIPTNDADENPYNFAINATVIAAPTNTGVTRQVSSSGTDSGNCQSSACKTLNYTLSQAANGDVITLAAGTYKENLTVNKSVTIQGATASGLVHNAQANTTIIDGDGANTKQRVMTVTNVIVKLSNVTITNGSSSGDNIAGGGGILNQGHLTLDNVLVTKNKTFEGI